MSDGNHKVHSQSTESYTCTPFVGTPAKALIYLPVLHETGGLLESSYLLVLTTISDVEPHLLRADVAQRLRLNPRRALSVQ